MTKKVNLILLIIGLIAFNFSSVEAQESQSITAASWSDGDYKWWKSNYSSFYLNKEADKLKMEFIKNDKGEVIEVKRNGNSYYIDEEGKSDFARYYKSSSEWCLFFKKNTIIIFKGGHDNIKIVGCIKSKCKSSDKEYIENWLADTEKLQTDDIEKYNKKVAEENDLTEQKKRDQYSIEGKSVASLEVVNLVVPEKFGHYRNFSFDIKAILNDGTEITTGDGNGYISDYEISYGDINYVGYQVEGEIIDADKITISVVSKYNSSLKTTKDVIIKYNENLKFSWNGTSWSRSEGENASSYKIEIKQTTHKITSEDLLMYRITNINTGSLIAEFKIGIDHTVLFYCKGGNGGVEDYVGNNGGDGGNITVIKDPNVKYYNLSYENHGGNGGDGEYNNKDGKDGRDGSFKEETRPVKF